ncbi:hypothetical protein H9I45_03420 [Polaribacter haliotis]|uniref:DUF1574 domain-containing protein n=1 Tax=Polaribacter haliotis TaxID=1888915 RepID=A0A7L8AHM8_9FLAO|nr:hypothetical protein [Polaribacter haliotis]QOD61513.1 hypothetical protein H9I45_03420 [Polaribacter haliotis]
MKNFIIKITFLVTTILITYILLGFLADGTTDPFYLRFTSPKQKSLILGTSRAAQGIRPQILNSVIDKNILNHSIYNFAFTILHSPYGETYYKAIKSKLDENSFNGLFILSVDPWSISQRTNLNYDIESKKELSKLTFFNMNPNYDYLVNSYKNSMFNLLINKFNRDSTLLLHKNGWLEVNINMEKNDLRKRTLSKIEVYKENGKIYEISDKRIFWLDKTIQLLKKHGRVILVRIPVNKEILAVENELCENFDSIINTRFNNLLYLNYKEDSNNYTFIDGNHLYKASGKFFSKKLANDINNLSFNE